MKPTTKVATARTPDGTEMALLEHDGDYSITVGGEVLMLSRQHESEKVLARLGGEHLVGREEASVLVGGLGMGYTLRAVLDMVGPRSRVVVSELLPAVVDWNREHLGDLAGRPLLDPRVELRIGDVLAVLRASRSAFDAILLDIDNGPAALTDAGNRRLYGREGLGICRRALRPGGRLAVWSAGSGREFAAALSEAGFESRLRRAPARAGGRSGHRFVWIARVRAGRRP